MKLSIAWIFDHIEADWKKVDIAHLVQLFNQKVAEIEGFTKIHIDVDLFSLASVAQVGPHSIEVFSKEWNRTYFLPSRKDAHPGFLYLIKQKNDQECVWVNAQDLGSSKDMLLPALHMDQKDILGNWKSSFESYDYILEIDNKSITHRPDMWGHRGFAREVAALLDLPFKPESVFIDDSLISRVKQHGFMCHKTQTNPFSINIRAPQACKRLAGTYFDDVQNRPSSMAIAHRLARVDARAIDAIVDLTNYVMLEWGQPMHAFDASSFDAKQLIVKMAKNYESVALLDGTTVELTDQDLILSDGDKVLGLAGVMGGVNSGVKTDSTSLLIESACFDAATIRKTAARYKKRTEASARFEKSLDPNQNVEAVMRFITLLRMEDIKAHQSDEIFSLGNPVPQTSIEIKHDLIENRLGICITKEFIQKILNQLGFGVTFNDGNYTIQVPTFRGAKDVHIKEDIIEEIGRFYGYTALEPESPRLPSKPSLNLQWVYQQRIIKNTLAYACQMQELYTYAFFDEEFLNVIKWQPNATLEVQSPVSENWRRLVTSLIPNLLKAVMNSNANHESLRFFELARIWQSQPQVNEQKSLAGIFFDKKNIDFYDAKSALQKLFDVLKLEISWKSISNPEMPWYAPYQTAHLMHHDACIGIAGKVPPTFLTTIGQGDAFVFELDAAYLLNFKHDVAKYSAVSKYPQMVRDISLFAPITKTSDQLIRAIAGVDSKINDVVLVDFIEKDEWEDKRAMTFRFTIGDRDRTMKKEEADVIWDAVVLQLKHEGASIR